MKTRSRGVSSRSSSPTRPFRALRPRVWRRKSPADDEPCPAHPGRRTPSAHRRPRVSPASSRPRDAPFVQSVWAPGLLCFGTLHEAAGPPTLPLTCTFTDGGPGRDRTGDQRIMSPSRNRAATVFVGPPPTLSVRECPGQAPFRGGGPRRADAVSDTPGRNCWVVFGSTRGAGQPPSSLKSGQHVQVPFRATGAGPP